MTPDQLQRIFAEASPDFSSEICTPARLDDLDPTAVDILRQLWQRKSPDQDISIRSVGQLLTDAELLVDGEVTYAALILLGTRKALGKYLAQAELIFEYRSNEVPGPAAERREFRQGFLPVLDEIWRLVNQRNDLQHFQQGFFIWDVPTFNERVVREAVLNAVSHRDYLTEAPSSCASTLDASRSSAPADSQPASLLRTFFGNKIRAIAVSPKSSANAAWSNGQGRGLTASSVSVFSRASRCPTSPTRILTLYGLRCTAIFKTQNSCVFWRRLVGNKWPHFPLTICW